MFKRILVAIDGSATSNQGLDTAIQLAADQHATLHVLHVLDDLTATPGIDGGFLPAEYFVRLIESLRQVGWKLLDSAAQRARERGVEVKAELIETTGRSVAETIVSQAREENVEVIVLGTHGRRGVRRLLLGSDAEAVLRDSPVPVLLVRDAGQRPSGPADAQEERSSPAGGRASAAASDSPGALVSF